MDSSLSGDIPVGEGNFPSNARNASVSHAVAIGARSTVTSTPMTTIRMMMAKRFNEMNPAMAQHYTFILCEHTLQRRFRHQDRASQFQRLHQGGALHQEV